MKRNIAFTNKQKESPGDQIFFGAVGVLEGHWKPHFPTFLCFSDSWSGGIGTLLLVWRLASRVMKGEMFPATTP